MKRVGIFAATRWELNAVRRAVPGRMRRLTARAFLGQGEHVQVMLMQTGVGMANADVVCREALQHHAAELVISTGFACALASSHIGNLLIGTEVVTRENDAQNSWGLESKVSCDQEAVHEALHAARVADLSASMGRFVTASRVLWRAEDKRQMSTATGAIGLDMESAAVGAVASERRVPFVIIRAVSDLLDEDLPLDFNLFLKPSGWPKGTLACLVQPSSLIGLKRLRAQAILASRRLTTFYQRFLNDL
jgi:adenosylhomocysteine nucleosidase